MGAFAVRLLALSGSLRAASSNTTLLRAAAALAPDDVEVILYDGVGDLPHFNPDLEDSLPLSVAYLRSEVLAADGLLISCPEYAHGVPGAFKNALDWLVGGPEFVGKPVALFSTSSRSTYAEEALVETLRTMSGRIVDEASVVVPLLGRRVDVDGIVSDPEMAGTLRRALAVFARAIEADRSGAG